MLIKLIVPRFSSKGFPPALYQGIVYCSGSNSSIQNAFVVYRFEGIESKPAHHNFAVSVLKMLSAGFCLMQAAQVLARFRKLTFIGLYVRRWLPHTAKGAIALLQEYISLDNVQLIDVGSLTRT